MDRSFARLICLIRHSWRGQGFMDVENDSGGVMVSTLPAVMGGDNSQEGVCDRLGVNCGRTGRAHRDAPLQDRNYRFAPP